MNQGEFQQMEFPLFFYDKFFTKGVSGASRITPRILNGISPENKPAGSLINCGKFSILFKTKGKGHSLGEKGAEIALKGFSTQESLGAVRQFCQDCFEIILLFCRKLPLRAEPADQAEYFRLKMQGCVVK